MMRTRFRELVGPAIFEAAFVVLGVILAYAANEWREARVHRQDAAAARGAILRELAANRASASASLAYHSHLLDTLQVIRQVNGTPDIRIFSRGFMMPAQLGATAWEVAEQTGVLNHMSYDDVLRFSRVYAEQERYDAQSLGVSQIIYADLYRAGPLAMASNAHQLASLIGIFRFRERSLLAVYDSVLADSAAVAQGTAPARPSQR